MQSTKILLVAASLILTAIAAIAAAPAASAHRACGQFTCCGLDHGGEPGSPDALADEAFHAVCFPIENAPGIVRQVGDLVTCIRTGNC